MCTTELIAFSKASTYFEKKNTCLIGLSVDSNSSHLAWIFDIYCKTGVRVPFPIIADRNGEIARKYGMIASNVSNTETVRNVFIIDPEGRISLILMYPMNIGRCVPEILRSLEALQMVENTESSTPANWTNGEPVICKIPSTFCELIEKEKEIKKMKNGLSWYLSFKGPELKCRKK